MLALAHVALVPQRVGGRPCVVDLRSEREPLRDGVGRRDSERKVGCLGSAGRACVGVVGEVQGGRRRDGQLLHRLEFVRERECRVHGRDIVFGGVEVVPVRSERRSHNRVVVRYGSVELFGGASVSIGERVPDVPDLDVYGSERIGIRERVVKLLDSACMAACVHCSAPVRQVHAGPDVCGNLSEVACVVPEHDARLPDGIPVADLAAPDVVA